MEDKKELREIEKRIIQYIKKYPESEYLKVLEQDSEIEVILALSKIRKNIISWYPFSKECTILEVGSNLGEITRGLCQKAKKVVAVEENSEKQEVIRVRNKEIKNLEIANSLSGIEEKFDYITVIGLEKLNKEPRIILNDLKKYIKPDGKILIATNNKFSANYISKLNSKNETIEFVSEKLYSLPELNKQIEQAGFKYKKVYYPITDYKMANAIFCDDNQIIENIVSRNIVYNDEGTIKLYEQNNLYRELAKENIEYLKMFLNSFFIEIFNQKIEDNGIKLVSFSNMRKEEYRIKTIMKEKYVYKYNENEKSKDHLNQIKENIDIMRNSKLNTLDEYDEEKIISKYTDEKSLDKVIIENLENNEKEKSIELIKRFRNELFEKMEKCEPQKNVFDKYNIKYNIENIADKTFFRYGLWDMTFQNCFIINNELYFYDQEWREEVVPIDFILYRAIKYFPEIRFYLSMEELYDILNIDESMIDLFEKLDNKLQENIRNNLMWKIHKQGKTVKELKIEKLTDNHTMHLQRTALAEKNEEINNLKNETGKLKQELESVYQSRSWKITKPLRKFTNRKNKK